MDFHSLSRRDLQTLCKKNRIPANITNVAMADALQALNMVEGISEIQESSKIRCATPKTTQRTASRKAAGRTTGEEPKEQQASPLPRSRRVTAKAPGIDVDETPKVLNTRRRAGPAPGRRTSQTTKKEAEETMTVGLRGSARVGGKSVVKMAALVKEHKDEREIGNVVDQKNDICCEGVVVENKEEEQKEEKEAGDFVDQNNDLCSEGVTTETKEEEKIEDKEIEEIDSLENTSDVCHRDESIQDVMISTDLNMEEEFLIESTKLEQQNPFTEELENVEKSEEENGKASDNEIPEEIKEADQMKVDDEAVQEEKEINDTEDLETNSSAETMQQEIKQSTGDVDFNLQEFSFAAEIPEEIEAFDVAEAKEFVSKMKVDDETAKGEEKEISDAEDLETKGSEDTVQAVPIPAEESSESDGMASETNEDSPIKGLITSEITAVEVETITKEVGELIADLSDRNLSSEEGNKTNESDNKENADVAVMKVGPRGGEVKKSSKAMNLNYENLSLRKLKAVYKEVVTIDNKGEEKRAALKAIDENCV